MMHTCAGCYATSTGSAAARSRSGALRPAVHSPQWVLVCGVAGLSSA